MEKSPNSSEPAALVMVFGVFDGLHPGHRHFLAEAGKFGKRIVAVVAPEEAVRMLKKKTPKHPLAERIAELLASGLVEEAVPGDEIAGSWRIFDAYRPDIVVLGYDQTKLRDALAGSLPRFPFIKRIAVVGAHKPEKFHSRLIPDRPEKSGGGTA